MEPFAFGLGLRSEVSGDAVDEALLDMAEGFYRLRACSDAKTTLDTLIKTQASSPLADKATPAASQRHWRPTGRRQRPVTASTAPPTVAAR